jgi:hypothetical protein
MELSGEGGFRRYLISQASKVKHDVEGNVLKWREDPDDYSESRLKSADFLDVMYSEGKSTRFVYMDRGTALDIVDKIRWSETKIRSLTLRLRLMYVVAFTLAALAIWGLVS